MYDAIILGVIFSYKSIAVDFPIPAELMKRKELGS